MADSNYLKTKVLVIGAGPSGLSFAISAKKKDPNLEICVIDKSQDAGNHILSGAIIDSKILDNFIEKYIGSLDENEELKKELSLKVTGEKMFFLPNSKLSFDILKILNIAKKFYKPFASMLHQEDYVVALSSFVRALENYAKKIGVEVYHSFAAKEVIFNEESKLISGVKLVDLGLNETGEHQINYKEGEKIECEFLVLAEGVDGLLLEDLVKKVGLKRKTPQLYSVAVKEIISVSKEQYESFGKNNVIHSLGYPLCNFYSINLFGGGIVYPLEDQKLAVGIIVGLDWKYPDFCAQDALERFKNHPAIKKYIDGGEVVEAGAKMIPEGGFNAIPRSAFDEIGFNNAIILGDSAGFVDMRKIKGVHNAIRSAEAGSEALIRALDNNKNFARFYTENLKNNGVLDELYFSRNFRQTISKFGNFFGMPLSIFSHFLPDVKAEEDFKILSKKSYPLKLEKKFNKDFFVAMAKCEHRETQPNHITILDPKVCLKCQTEYNSPCIAFCPAGVYEKDSGGEAKPLNPSNCLHCKTCQRKCPYQNIKWSVPEGGSGTKYRRS